MPKDDLAPDSGDLEFGAVLRVSHTYTRNGAKHRYSTSRTHRFALPMGPSFASDTYRGETIGGHTLTIGLQDPFTNGTHRATQEGTLVFTVIYQHKTIGTATYRYLIRFTPGSRIKEGTDAFFNYCLGNPDAHVFSSGGTLYCYGEDDEQLVVRRIK